MTITLSVAFLLPSSGGGGGANSVVQEALGLNRIGVRTLLIVDRKNFFAFRQAYPEVVEQQQEVAAFDNARSLGALMAGYDVVCATTAMSVKQLEAGLAELPAEAKPPKVAYYVQDYEPLFFREGSSEWREARASYRRIPGAQLFAKTDWICAVVQANHDVPVARVKASVDHTIYYPDFTPRPRPLTIIAMLRPKTKRRAPIRTARIMNWLAQEFGDGVRLELFGCAEEEIQGAGLSLPAACFNHGRLRRTQVPRLLRHADLFLDLSDYQAFGRTGIEAMASGCTPLVPSLGGTSEYARHNHNALVVDTRSDAAVKDAIRGYLAMSAAERMGMKINGLAKAAEFGIPQAVASELKLFLGMVDIAPESAGEATGTMATTGAADPLRTTGG